MSTIDLQQNHLVRSSLAFSPQLRAGVRSNVAFQYFSAVSESIILNLGKGPVVDSLLRWGAMLSGTPWYLQGRQFGLYLASQRPLGKLSSFYSFYVFIDLTHIFLFSSFLFYICISCVLLYISSVCLYSLLFHLLCVTNRSQTVE